MNKRKKLSEYEIWILMIGSSYCKTYIPVPKVVCFVQCFQGQKLIMICPCYELKLIHAISTTVCNKPLGSIIPKETNETQFSL